MSITREQVADLRSQDVVRLTNRQIPGLVVEGELYEVQGVLGLSSWMPVRRTDGEPALNWLGWDLTVISRAPRPLYVNHDRNEPVPGDVFQPEYSQWPLWIAGNGRIAEHKSAESCRWIGAEGIPARLRLLVDGETGEVVP